ncbi:MAG: hypothetical protein ACKVOP_03700 [Sphingomonadaceae bacterium]
MTKTHSRNFALFLALSSLTNTGAHAQTAAPASNDLMDFSCGQYLQSVNIANPGTKPSAQRQAQAVPAQDALASAMMWIHGYTSGKSGQSPAPLTREWMIGMVGTVSKACREKSNDGTMRVADAVSQM